MSEALAQPTSSRDDVAAAFTAVEAKTEPVKIEPVKAEPAKIEPVKVEPAKAEPAQLRGEPGPANVEPAKTEPVKAEPVKAEPAKTEPVKVEPAKPWESRLAKPPTTWKPETREQWEQIPAAARIEIHRRESEAYKAIQTSKAAREFQQSFMNVAQPYAATMAQEGSNPLESFRDYLKTAHMLRTGLPQEKAMAVARAIQQFGVPIELLDQALAGVLKGGGNGQAGAGQFRDPRVDQLLGTLAQQRTAREQALNQEIDQELGEFAVDPKNEYYHDVRDIMADVLEVAARRNEKLSLQQAYERSTMLHPEVSKLVRTKDLSAEQERLTKAAQAAKAAAVQVTGAPGAPGGVQASDGSVRGAIEASIAQLSGR